jgi:hypothetical protein
MIDNKIIARMNEIRELLDEFGLHLGGYDPGVMAWTKNDVNENGHFVGETIQFDRAEWKWLEPILCELRNYRRSDKRRRGCKKKTALSSSGKDNCLSSS